ncbi:MAG: ribonuclease P protein component [Candidatus Shapirobacteria bacterium]
MLQKKDRLTKKKDFQDVRLRGRMIQSPLFGLNYLNSENGNKFGFIISKKISKRAVDRNRIKRLLAEGVRMNMDKIKVGVWGVFLAKKTLLGKKFEEVEGEVRKVFGNL